MRKERGSGTILTHCLLVSDQHFSSWVLKKVPAPETKAVFKIREYWVKVLYLAPSDKINMFLKSSWAPEQGGIFGSVNIHFFLKCVFQAVRYKI